MKIELDIKEPGNNTNEKQGTINIYMDQRYAYINHRGKNIIVDAEELYKTINTLYRGDTRE